MHPAEYDYCKIKDMPGRLPVWENETVKIGQYNFRTILLSGHTPGSLAYFDEEKGLLFPGDFVPEGAEEFMFGPGRNIRAYRESLSKIYKLKDKIKAIYQPHGKAVSDSSIIDEYIEMVDLVLEGKLQGEECEVHDHKVLRVTHKRAGIFI